MAIPFTLTNESLSVIIDGESFTVKREDVNYLAARQAVFDANWEALPGLVNRGKRIEEWAQGLFTFKEGALLFQGKAVPPEINAKFATLANAGQDPRPVMRFFQKLQANPSHHSVTQLFRFMAQASVPIMENGDLMGYKAVRADYFDMRSGTIQYSIGKKVGVERNTVADDPQSACAPGLHVGTKKYLEQIGQYASAKWLIVAVNPADVVSVPYDYNSQKMRVCAMTVLGHYGAELPDAFFKDEEDVLEGVTGSTKIHGAADWFLEGVPDVGSKSVPPSPRPRMPLLPEALEDDEGNLEYDEEDDEEDEDSEYDDGAEDAEVVVQDDGKWGEDLTVHVAVAPSQTPDVKAKSEMLKARKLVELREYASSLGIKNVKAVPGGKEGLIERILLVETDPRHPTAKSGAAAPDPTADLTYDDVHQMKAAELGKQSIDTLRKYARNFLHIIGASKLPGGKETLIQRILLARSS